MSDPRMNSKTGLQDKKSVQNTLGGGWSVGQEHAQLSFMDLYPVASWIYILTYTCGILLHTCM